MTDQLLVELIGTFAAIVVFVSYLFNNQLALRLVNIIASCLFIIYGFFLAAVSGWVNGWSTIALNSGCLIVHIVWIVRYKRKDIDDDQENP